MITRAKISAVRASGVQRLFEGGAYYLFCPRCGTYSRAVYSSKYGTPESHGALWCLEASPPFD